MFAKKVTRTVVKEVEIWRYTSLLSPIPYPLSPIPSSTSKGVMEEQKIKGRDLYDTIN
jgi:hypothetical protein